MIQLEDQPPVQLQRIRDPARRTGATRAIAGLNMCIGISSLFYHIWSLVWCLKEPERITATGQTEVVVYIGIAIMIIISFILLPVSWNLWNRLNEIRSNSRITIRAGRSWRRWIGCFLTFYVTSLMILVLSSGNQNVVQNYMAGLLILISFSIYGIYYVGKLLNELKIWNGGPSSVPPNVTNAAVVSVNNLSHQIIHNTSVA